MGANYGTMLLNKVIETENVQALDKHRLNKEHFVSKADQDVYSFIVSYSEQNNGDTPSYATVVEEFPQFVYVPGVTDGFAYLSGKVRERAAEVSFMKLMEQDVPKMYEEYENGEGELERISDMMQDKLQQIRESLTDNNRVGFDIKKDTDDFMSEYKRRQLGESFTVWKSAFPFVDKAVGGGYTTGNMYTVYGRSGRGKSVISLYEVANMAMQGATCLVWSLEMSTYETVVRLYTFISAMKGTTVATVDGQEYNAGFDANQLRNGDLDGDMEQVFTYMLKEINSYIEGTIIVRGSDDPTLRQRNVAQIRQDIRNTQADVVVVDPFYYLDYEANKSKTTGGDAAETSKQLRIMSGQENVVMIVITQADEDDKETSNDGTREIKLPKRSEVKKTSQLLEDAAVLIVVDTDYKQKLGRIGLNKGRNGGEGDSAEIIYIPHLGILEEAIIDSEKFGF